MTKLKDIQAILPPEHEKFKKAEISTTDELWKRLADYYPSSTQDFFTKIQLDKPRGFEILGEVMVHDQSQGSPSWFVRYIVQIVGVLLVLVLLALVLRAGGWLEAAPAPIGLKQEVVVAARDLIKGSVIDAGDVHSWSRGTQHRLLYS